jgi:2,3-diketo-5-methylthio-1-phosphopentane phosphatase
MDLFCDFDGTITLHDTTDAVLETFASPIYREWEQQWEEGAITSLECMQRQTELIQATPESIRNFLEHITVDPGIYLLEEGCRATGSSLTILSDGIDFLMEGVLQRLGLSSISHYANRLNWNNEGGYFLTFPHRDWNCEAGSGVCKCKLMEKSAPSGREKVYVGDGLSDRCVVHRADRVFAKKRLQDYCLTQGIAHVPFRTLTEVALLLFPTLFPDEPIE